MMVRGENEERAAAQHHHQHQQQQPADDGRLKTTATAATTTSLKNNSGTDVAAAAAAVAVSQENNNAMFAFWDNLPSVILLEVFSYLPRESRIQASQVSKKFEGERGRDRFAAAKSIFIDSRARARFLSLFYYIQLLSIIYLSLALSLARSFAFSLYVLTNFTSRARACVYNVKCRGAIASVYFIYLRAFLSVFVSLSRSTLLQIRMSFCLLSSCVLLLLLYALCSYVLAYDECTCVCMYEPVELYCFPFLCFRIKVCRNWRCALFHPSFWKKITFTLVDDDSVVWSR